jgi:hypothetical protein
MTVIHFCGWQIFPGQPLLSTGVTGGAFEIAWQTHWASSSSAFLMNWKLGSSEQSYCLPNLLPRMGLKLPGERWRLPACLDIFSPYLIWVGGVKIIFPPANFRQSLSK